MNNIQKEIVKKLQDDGLDYKADWGFGGAWPKGLDELYEDTPEEHVVFSMFIASPCFDCESMYCEDKTSCDEENDVVIQPDGTIYYSGTGETYNTVDDFINRAIY